MTSQVQIVGQPAPKTWDDYERGCLATFGGGYRNGADIAIFRHGMSTVFNLLRNEFPDACNPGAATPADESRSEFQQAWAELKQARESVTWWQGVAEAKQEERDAAIAERDRLRAGLEMLAQIRSVSGNAQPAFRSQLRTIDAILAGADIRDLPTVEAIAAGTWKTTEEGR